jgi:hypothetical protein
MSSRNERDQRAQATRRAPPSRGGPDAAGADASGGYAPEPSRRRGPHLGPIAITPLRVMLLVALIGGLGFLAYSLLVRDTLQVPLMATGFIVCGIVFALMSLLAVLAVIRAGRERRDGAAVLAALAGGMLAVASLLSLAAGTIFAMIWGGTKTG